MLASQLPDFNIHMHVRQIIDKHEANGTAIIPNTSKRVLQKQRMIRGVGRLGLLFAQST